MKYPPEDVSDAIVYSDRDEDITDPDAGLYTNLGRSLKLLMLRNIHVSDTKLVIVCSLAKPCNVIFSSTLSPHSPASSGYIEFNIQKPFYRVLQGGLFTLEGSGENSGKADAFWIGQRIVILSRSPCFVYIYGTVP